MTVANPPMKVRQRFNSTTPAHELTDFHTPNEKLFVVYHMRLGIKEQVEAKTELAPSGLAVAALVQEGKVQLGATQASVISTCDCRFAAAGAAARHHVLVRHPGVRRVFRWGEALPRLS